MKWPIRILATLAGLLGALALALGWCASEPGTRWLMQQLPDNIQVANSSGSLLNQLTLTKVRVTYPGGQLTVDKALLQWDPWALLGGTLHLRRLQLEQLTVAVESSGSSDNDSDIALPSLSLPLRLQVDNLQLEQLSYRDQNTSITVLSRAQLRAVAFLHRVQLHSLTLERPEGQLSLAGSLRLDDDYPLQLDTVWQVNTDQTGALRGQGSLSGSLRGLRVQQQVSGELAGSVDIEVDTLSPALDWQARVTAQQLALARWVPAASALRLDAHVDARGDRQQLAGALHLSTRHPELGPLHLRGDVAWRDDRLTITQATLDQPQQQRQLTAQGTISELGDEPLFELSGRWQELGYPLMTPEYRSPNGQYAIKGRLDHYVLTLEGAVAETANNPPARVQLTASGSLTGIEDLDASADTLDGTLHYRGRLGWQEQFSWDGELTAVGINPAWFSSEWVGSLEGRLLSAGTVEAFSAELPELTGQLRDQPLSGRAAVTYSEKRWSIRTAEVILDQSQRFQLSGQIDDAYDLRWQFNAPALPPWVPGVSGNLSGKGTLQGPLAEPRIGARLQGRSVSITPLQLAAQAFNADLSLDLNPQAPSRLQLQIDAPTLASQAWQQARFQATGTLGAHSLQLSLDSQPLTLQAKLAGGWNEDHWLGALNQLELKQAKAGRWSLKESAPFTASPTQIELATTCLRQQQAQACVQGNWQPDALDARLNLAGLAIEPWMAAILPTAMRGTLGAEARLYQTEGQPLQLQADARVDNLQIELEPELWLSIDHATTGIQGNEQRLVIQSNVASSELDGQLALNGALIDPLAELQWNAQLQGQLSDLRLLSLFTPDIQSPTGQVAIAAQLQGDRSQFRWRGTLSLRDGAFELPATGIKLQQVALTLQDDAKQHDLLRLTGHARSGDGEVKLEGRFEASARRLHLSIQGEDFLAAATQDARVVISPDLSLELDPNRLHVSGAVRIPQALLTPLEPSGRITASNDVTFVGQHQPSDQTPYRYDARIRLILGDDVRFEGFGVKSRLEGNLLISDNAISSTRASGTIQVARGRYRLYGQDLDIERGRFIFSGGPIENPGLDLRITRKVEEVEVGAQISGTLQQSDLRLFSTPAMPAPELLSYLLLGRPPGSTDTDEQALALRAAIALGMSGGNKLGERLTERLPVDDLGLESDTAENTSFYIGKYLSPTLYVRYGMGLIEPTTTFFIRYKLSDKWSFESQTGTTSSAADLIYTIER